MPKIRPNLSKMSERWPSAIVARRRIEQFTDGIITVSFLARMDARGQGPKGRIRVNGRVAYPVDSVIAWLEGLTETFIDHQDTEELR